MVIVLNSPIKLFIQRNQIIFSGLMAALVNQTIFWTIVVAIIIIIFIVGFFTSKQGIDIAGCRAEWNTIEKTAKSDICPTNETCKIDPYVEQHNAITSALICACDKARSGSEYPNQQLNQRIVDVYNSQYGSHATVSEVCESGLVRIRY